MGIEHDPLGIATLSAIAAAPTVALPVVIAPAGIKARSAVVTDRGFSPPAALDQSPIAVTARVADRGATAPSCLR